MKTRGQIKSKERRKDITEGKEKHPIPVYGVPADASLPEFTYIKRHTTRNAFYPPRDRLELKGCKCRGKCNPCTCECIKYSKEINEILECGEECGCNENCDNRKCENMVMPKMYLQYGNTINRYGVFANEKILRKTIVASYAGEICEIKNHIQLADSDYTFQIESCVSKNKVEIDGTHFSNIARFFNHSCNANLKTKIAYFGANRMAYPVFIAKRKIQKGEELTIDYGDQYFSIKGISCNCGECDENLIL